MSLSKVNADGSLTKIGGLVDDTDLKQDIAGIQAVIPSGASASNPLIADDRIIRLAVGNRNLTTVQSDIQTIVASLAVGYYPVHFSIYMLHDNTYLTDGWGVVTGTVHKYTTGIYNIDLIISQSGLHTKTTFIKDSSTSAGSWTSQKLVTTSDLTSTVASGSTAPITSGGVYSAISGGQIKLDGSNDTGATITRTFTRVTGNYLVSIGGWHSSGQSYRCLYYLSFNPRNGAPVIKEINTALGETASGISSFTGTESNFVVTLTVVSTSSANIGNGITLTPV